MYNIEKYKALAGGNPRGILLRTVVDREYSGWLSIVENAPWLRNWVRSSLYGCEDPRAPLCCNPSGGLVEKGAQFTHHRIADAIYATAIWGFGMCNWSDKEACATIIALQGLSSPNRLRQYMFDGDLQKRYGINMPLEIGELDKWLEILWIRTYIDLK